MNELVWLDGAYVTPHEASWKLTDRGALLGDGVFETLRAVDGRPRALAGHLARLAHGADVLGIALPVARDRLSELVHEFTHRLALPDAVIRVTLHRGPGPRGLATDGFDAPTLAITGNPHRPHPAERYADGVVVETVALRRIPPECLDPTIKHANVLPAILARRTLGAHVHEGIMRSITGHVACGLASNVFAVVDGRLVTPPLTTGCLAGITRARVLELARGLHLDPEEAHITPDELTDADEAFLTSSLIDVLPIRQLDGTALASGRGPITDELARALADDVAAAEHPIN